MADTISSLPPLRDVIATYGLRAEKSFGQNFLLDLNLTQKIARQAGDLSGKHVVEIGPGPGGLTRALVMSDAASVTAIEFDPRCITALEGLKAAAGERLNLIHGDALESDLLQIVPHAPRVVIANLPYNIATPLLIQWLRNLYDHAGCYDALALMFQKEVGDRITAKVGEKAYGRLGIISQWLCQTSKAMTLPPSAFTPPPKIHSTVVLFRPRQSYERVPFEMMEMLTAKAFGQRRKMVRQSLKDYVSHFEKIGIDPTARAEELGIEAYTALASSISNGTP